ncbi:hypothetical protein Tco_0262107 [Tanacetum coccineum]
MKDEDTVDAFCAKLNGFARRQGISKTLEKSLLITGKLKAFEERIKLRKGGQVESQENLLFAHGEHSGKGRRFSKRREGKALQGFVVLAVNAAQNKQNEHFVLVKKTSGKDFVNPDKSRQSRKENARVHREERCCGERKEKRIRDKQEVEALRFWCGVSVGTTQEQQQRESEAKRICNEAGRNKVGTKWEQQSNVGEQITNETREYISYS